MREQLKEWSGRGRFGWLFIVVLAWLGAGCRAFQSAAELPTAAVRSVTPGGQKKDAVDPVELQQRVLRIADEFSAAMIAGVDRLRRGTNEIGRAEALKWKIVFASESSSIASGPNAIANLLDMTVFVTVARITVEDYWQPRVYGESALPLLASCRRFETQVWAFASTVIKPEQQAELREAIAAWRRSHPTTESVLGARAVGFAAQLVRTQANQKPDSGSVFSLLRLDPLSGLDPATREIAQTRLFAERALYIAQWMPTLLRWQTELLSLNAMAMPEVQQLLANSTRIAASVERFAAVAEQLPQQVSTERAEILKSLESQEKALTPLVGEVRDALTSGEKMSTSLNTTLITFDALMKRFGFGETNNASPPDTNAPPFSILDYARTAEEMTTLTKALDATLKDFGNTFDSPAWTKRMADLNGLARQTKADAKSVLNHSFLLAAGLILLTFASALTYRRLVPGAKPAPRRDPE